MTKPFLFQLEGVEFIERKNGRALIADDMGLGKTMQALLYAHRNKHIRPVIVVCPASVKFGWQDEAAKHFRIRSEILYGTKPRSHKRQLIGRPPLLIINYEILKHWVKYLRKLKPQLVVADEVHRLKNPRAQCSKAFRDLVEDVDNVVGLGGTAMENRPTDLWNFCNILRPRHKAFRAFLPFAFKYSKAKRTRYGWQFKGARNKQELHKLLTRTIMIRRLKSQVLDQLPKKNRLVLAVEMSNPKEYQEAKNDFRRWLRKSMPDRANKASRKQWRAEQLIQLGYLKRLAAKLKLKSVMDWIDTFLESTDEKLIVFGIHKSIITALKERYKDQCVTFTGDTSGPKRKQRLESFTRNPRIRLFIANVRAAGVGLNGLQHVASTVLNVELDFKPSTHNQADDRVYRMGQTKQCFCYYLVAKDSIEEPICRILQQKEQDINSIMDGQDDGGPDMLDIYDQLTEILNSDNPKPLF